MSDKPDDFERACDAFADGSNAGIAEASIRAGMLAVLREMREFGTPASIAGDMMAGDLSLATHMRWRRKELDELIRQGESE